MSVSKLATSLTVIFTVTIVILVAELLFILIRRQRLRNPSQPQQPQPQNQNPNHSTKELLYFLCMKTQTRVEPSGPPTQTPDRDSSNDNENDNDNDTVIDVFKMLEENGRNSRVLCTIKEDDREDGGESTLTTVSGVETVSLQECFEAEVAEERRAKCDVEVEDCKTVFSSSPCDSPMFFTPIGSPTRDGVSTVIGER